MAEMRPSRSSYPEVQAVLSAPTHLSAWSRYALAIALVSVALFLSLGSASSVRKPFLAFFPRRGHCQYVVLRAGPGWVAVGLSTLAVLYYFIPPVRSFTVKPRDVPFFLTFVACQLIANWLISWRRANRRLP